MKLFTTAQVHEHCLKLYNWLHNEPKQKEYIVVSTNRCDVDRKDNTFCFMDSWILPEQFILQFYLTNDHIEREECKYEKAKFSFDFNLN